MSEQAAADTEVGSRDLPLLVTTDPVLLDDVQRLAAAADMPVRIVGDQQAARLSWREASLVLVGADLVAELAADPPPRRGAVVVVAEGVPSDTGHDILYRSAVGIGAQDVAVLPDAEDWLVGMLAEAAEPARAAARTICVVGGCGGAGASVLAAGLAVTAMRGGASTLLVDGDPLGGGIDLVIGSEGCAGARWPDLIARRGRLSFSALRAALPTIEGLTVLSWHRGDTEPVPGAAMRAVLTAGQRGADLVIVDLPRHLDEAAAEALAAADLTLLVVPAAVRAVAAAGRVAASLRGRGGRLGLVVRTGEGRVGPDVVAVSLGLTRVGQIRTEPRLARAVDDGLPPGLSGRGSLAACCSSLLREALEPARQPA